MEYFVNLALYFVSGYRMESSHLQVSDFCQQLPNKLLSTGETPSQWADSPFTAQSCADDLSYICKSFSKRQKSYNDFFICHLP